MASLLLASIRGVLSASRAPSSTSRTGRTEAARVGAQALESKHLFSFASTSSSSSPQQLPLLTHFTVQLFFIRRAFAVDNSSIASRSSLLSAAICFSPAVDALRLPLGPSDLTRQPQRQHRVSFSLFTYCRSRQQQLHQHHMLKPHSPLLLQVRGSPFHHRTRHPPSTSHNPLEAIHPHQSTVVRSLAACSGRSCEHTAPVDWTLAIVILIWLVRALPFPLKTYFWTHSPSFPSQQPP